MSFGLIYDDTWKKQQQQQLIIKITNLIIFVS